MVCHVPCLYNVPGWGVMSCVYIQCRGGCHVLCMYTVPEWCVMPCVCIQCRDGVSCPVYVYFAGMVCHVLCLYTVPGWCVMSCVCILYRDEVSCPVCIYSAAVGVMSCVCIIYRDGLSCPVCIYCAGVGCHVLCQCTVLGGRSSCGRADIVMDSHSQVSCSKPGGYGILSTALLTDYLHTSIRKLSVRWCGLRGG